MKTNKLATQYFKYLHGLRIGDKEKQRGFELLEMLYDEAEANNDIGMRRALVELYALHYKKAAGVFAKEPEAWVNKAASNDACRPSICNAYSDGEFLVATDVHRLHYIRTELPVGFYDRNMRRIDNDNQFPDWKKVVPILCYENEKIIEFDWELESVYDINKKEIGARLKLSAPSQPSWLVAVNKKYLDEAWPDKFLIVESQVDDALKPLSFKNKHGFGVIMPMRE